MPMLTDEQKKQIIARGGNPASVETTLTGEILGSPLAGSYLYAYANKTKMADFRRENQSTFDQFLGSIQNSILDASKSMNKFPANVATMLGAKDPYAEEDGEVWYRASGGEMYNISEKERAELNLNKDVEINDGIAALYKYANSVEYGIEKWKWQAPSNPNEFWTTLGQGVGTVISFMAASPIRGASIFSKASALQKLIGLGGGAISGTLVMSDQYIREAKAAGIDDRNAANFGLGLSGVIGMSERLGLDYIGKAASTPFIRSAMKKARADAFEAGVKVMVEEGGSKGVTNALRASGKMYSNALKTSGLAMAEGAAGEFVQEFTQTYMEDAAKQLYDNVFAEMPMFKENTFDQETLFNALKSGMYGAIIGGGMSSIGSMQSQEFEEALFTAVDEAKNKDALVKTYMDRLSDLQKRGKLDENGVKYGNELIDKIRNFTTKGISPDVTNKEARYEAYLLLDLKKELEEKISNITNPDLVPDYLPEQLGFVTEKIKEIANTNKPISVDKIQTELSQIEDKYKNPPVAETETEEGVNAEWEVGQQAPSQTGAEVPETDIDGLLDGEQPEVGEGGSPTMEWDVEGAETELQTEQIETNEQDKTDQTKAQTEAKQAEEELLISLIDEIDTEVANLSKKRGEKAKKDLEKQLERKARAEKDLEDVRRELARLRGEGVDGTKTGVGEEIGTGEEGVAQEGVEGDVKVKADKVDIERRREEELKIAKRKFEFLNKEFIPKLEENTNVLIEQYDFQKSELLKNTGDLNYVESKYGKTFEDWIPLQIKWLKENKSHLLVDSRNSESRDYKTLRLLQEKNDAENKINAKYDAELKALETPTTSNQESIAKEVEDLTKQEDKKTFTIGFAPFREGNIKNIESGSKKAFADKRYNQWLGLARKIAEELGISINIQDKTIGVYEGTSNNAEASSLVSLEGTKQQVELFAAIMGSLAPDVQNSVMMLDYADVGSAIELRIKFENKQDAVNFIENRAEYGANDLSLNPETNEVLVLDEGKFNYKKLIQDYGKSVKTKQRGTSVRFISEESYSGIIREARDRMRGRDSGVNRENLDAILEHSKNRADRRSGNLLAKSEQEKVKRRKKVSDYLSSFANKFGIPAIGNIVENPKPQRGFEIKKEYDKLKSDNSKDPVVKRAYEQLAKEVVAQYNYMTKVLGIDVVFTENDPYENSEAMMADVYDNNRLVVFKGGEPHPFLDKKDADGISINEKFRAVHDYFGHAIEGNQFGAIGEERAWIAHSKMFSPLARRAMTTETRGQNSWVNNADVNKKALELFKEGNQLIQNGEVAKGKKIIEEAKKQFVFAEQKVDLLPEEFSSLKEYEKTSKQEQEGKDKADALKDKIKSIIPETKIVNKNNEPIKVYHGTRGDGKFTEFENGDIGFHFGRKETAQQRGDNVLEVYLNIKNPIDIKDKGAFEGQELVDSLYEAKVLTKAEYDYFTKEMSELPVEDIYGYNTDINKQLRDKIKEKGYDGFTYTNMYEGAAGKSIIALDKNQIIFADGRNLKAAEQPPQVRPQKQVKANQKIATEEVAEARGEDVGDMNVLYSNQFRNLPVIDDTDTDAMLTYEAEGMPNGLEKDSVPPQIRKRVERLFEKGYLYYDGGMFYLTPKGAEIVDAIDARLETRQRVKGGTDLFPNEASIEENELTEATAKSVANKIRGLKINTKGKAFDATLGLPVAIYNGAVELIATSVEGGMMLKNAIAKAMKYIDGQMNGKDWNKGLFAKNMNVRFAVTLPNGEKAIVERDTSKKTAEVINGWYMPIEQKLLDSKKDVMPANNWAGLFRSKEDEDLWTGVRDWLESKGTDSVSKKEIQDFIKNNRVEIVEVVKGGDIIKKDETKLREIESQLESRGFTLELDMGGEGSMLIDKDGEIAEYEGNEDAYALLETYNQLSGSEFNQYSIVGQPDTKFSNYQLEGEKENYKEVLVTMPKKKTLPNANVVVKSREETLSDKSNYTAEEDGDYFVVYGFRGSRKSIKKGYNISTKEQAINQYIADELSFEKANTFDIFDNNGNYIETALAPTKDRAKEIYIGRNTTEEPTKFKSTHFDEPNILVHLRMNTRTDSEGSKILFLEEIQSDWGQKGKKEGFEGTQEVKDAIKKRDEIIASYKKLYPIEWEAMRAAAADQRIRDLDKIIGGTKTPQAPFVTDTNAWTKLGLKVALKEAVAQGADKIAWTTGEQQNERYDLSKQVDNITYQKTKDGNFDVVIVDKNNNDIYDKQNVTINELESVVGKDVATKMNNFEGENTELENGEFNEYEKILSGDGLKVGGKGMKGFYGSPTEGSLGIVGNVAKSLFKQEPKTLKLQTKREVQNKDIEKLITEDSEEDIWYVDIDGREETFDSYQAAFNYAKDFSDEIGTDNLIEDFATQHSIDITPELKTQVGKGLPLFGGLNKIGENTLGSAIASAKALDQAFKAGIDLSESVEDNIQEMEDKGIIEKDCK